MCVYKEDLLRKDGQHWIGLIGKLPGAPKPYGTVGRELTTLM